MGKTIKNIKLYCKEIENKSRLIWYFLHENFKDNQSLLIYTFPIADLKKQSKVPKKSIISEDFVIRAFDDYTIDKLHIIDNLTDNLKNCWGPYYILSNNSKAFLIRFYEEMIYVLGKSNNGFKQPISELLENLKKEGN